MFFKKISNFFVFSLENRKNKKVGAIMTKYDISPPLKWAGGKRSLLEQIDNFLPKTFNTYFEPFIGGGALLFYLQPENAVIGDLNENLIDVYKTLQRPIELKLMENTLDEYEAKHSEEFYFQIRSQDTNPDFKNMPIWLKASRMIYLNKACFNGLYRVNSKGFFNVSFGKKDKVITYNKDNLESIHRYFIENNVHILCTDFANITKNAKKDDFVYFDPPYDVLENKQSFTNYQSNGFTKDDQIRLKKEVDRLTSLGVKCMISNHNTNFILDLYKDYNIHNVQAKRIISRNVESRGYVTEVLITNY